MNKNTTAALFVDSDSNVSVDGQTVELPNKPLAGIGGKDSNKAGTGIDKSANGGRRGAAKGDKRVPENERFNNVYSQYGIEASTERGVAVGTFAWLVTDPNHQALCAGFDKITEALGHGNANTDKAHTQYFKNILSTATFEPYTMANRPEIIKITVKLPTTLNGKAALMSIGQFEINSNVERLSALCEEILDEDSRELALMELVESLTVQYRTGEKEVHEVALAADNGLDDLISQFAS